MREGNDWDVVVVGAGAAGLMAAIFASREGARVALLETTVDGGRKILISGGGRCNVLPSRVEPERYVTASSRHTLRKILLSWPLAEQRGFFEKDLGIALTLEAESGKLFPASNRAREVRDALVGRAMQSETHGLFGCRVTAVEPGPMGGWRVRAGGELLRSATVVIATGGLSVPKTGSDGQGLAIVERLGHTVHETYPALTPLTADPPVHTELAGVSLRVGVTAPPPGGPMEAEGGFLFTHRGYSGPAVLDISHLAIRSMDTPRRQAILVRWGEATEEEWTRRLAGGGAGAVLPLVRRHLPARLAERLVEEAGVAADRPLAQLRRGERHRLLERLVRYPLPWTGSEGYKKAEVTGGGVSLAEIDPITLESRRTEGLFLCGEILDAFGPIGGYNFAWAWSTGRAAGIGAAARVQSG